MPILLIPRSAAAAALSRTASDAAGGTETLARASVRSRTVSNTGGGAETLARTSVFSRALTDVGSSSGTPAAPTVTSMTSADTGSVTTLSVSLTVPATATVGAYAVLIAHGVNNGVLFDGPPTGGAGGNWVQDRNAAYNSNQIVVAAWHKTLEAADIGATLTLTTSAARAKVVTLLVFAGGAFDAVGADSVTSVAATSIPNGGVTTAGSTESLLNIICWRASTSNTTRTQTVAPTGFVELGDPQNTQVTQRGGIAVNLQTGVGSGAQSVSNSTFDAAVTAVSLTYATAPAAETLTRRVVTARTVNETAAGSDAVSSSSTSGGLTRTASDAAAGSETLTRAALSFARTASDAAGGGESLTRSTSRPRALSDTAAGTESVGRQLLTARAVSDAAAGTESITRAAALPRPLSDAAAGSDALTRAPLSRARSVSDAGNGSDAVSGGLSGGGTRSISDVGGGAETISRLVAYTRTLSNTAAGSDTLNRALAAARTAVDAANGSDVLNRTVARSRTATDAASGVDAAPNRTITRGRALTDTAAGSAAVSRVLAQMRTAVDAAGGGEQVDAAWSGLFRVGLLTQRQRATATLSQRIDPGPTLKPRARTTSQLVAR